MFRNTGFLFAGTLILLGTLTISVGAEDSSGENDALALAKTYFEAMDASNLDDAGNLFAAESSIFETGGVEGTWDHYREHHLGPEIDAISEFRTSLGEPEYASSSDGSMALVAWPIEYHIELADQRAFDSKGTVTFVLVETDEGLRIRHLHWSSRRKQ